MSERLAMYDAFADFYSEAPSEVEGVFNSSVEYYRQILYRQIFSIFKFHLPDTWPENYFKYNLFPRGFIGITDTPVGIIPLHCGFTGVNVFEQPTNLLFANPVIGSFERTIDVDCTMVYIQYNYRGIEPTVQRYATLLAMCDRSISVNLMNANVAFVGLSDSKAGADTLKKIYDDMTQGKPAVYHKKSDNIEWYFNNVKNTFIAQDVQLLKRMIYNEFLTDFGINNANLDKRERMLTDEVNANNQQLMATTDDFFINISKGFDKANKMFPELHLGVERRFDNEPVKPDGVEPGGTQRNTASGGDGRTGDGK